MYTSDNPFKLGIVGLGIGRSLGIPAIELIPEIELVSVWSRRQSQVDKAISDFKVKGFTSFDHFIADQDLDGVWIATPPSLRPEFIKKAIQNNKHFFLEKPLSVTSDCLTELKELAREKSLSCGVDFEYRCVPLFQKTKDLLEAQWIGKPQSIEIRWMMGNRSDPSVPYGWYNSKLSGGGIIGAIASHHFDLLLWWFGDIKSVSTIASTVIKERVEQNSDIQRSCDTPETAFIGIEFSNSALGSINVSCVTRDAPAQSIEIYGDKGRIKLISNNTRDAVRGFTLDARQYDGNELILEPHQDLLEKDQINGMIIPIKKMLSRWVDNINIGTPMEPSIEQGIKVQKVIDSAHQSWEEGRKINLI